MFDTGLAAAVFHCIETTVMYHQQKTTNQKIYMDLVSASEANDLESNKSFPLGENDSQVKLL